MLTVEVLLRLDDAAPRDQLDGPLAAEAERIKQLLTHVTVRTPKSLAHHRDQAIASGESLEGFDQLLKLGGLPPAFARVPLESFDAVLEVRVPDDVRADLLVGALDGMVERLDASVDAARSCAVIGTEHTIIEGDGPLQLFYAFRRIPSVTHDAFLEYWKSRLVEQTTKTPGKSGYCQLHADPVLSARLALAVGVSIDDYDGVALEWYPSLESFMNAVSWASEPDAAIIQSEANINDFISSLSMLAYDND